MKKRNKLVFLFSIVYTNKIIYLAIIQVLKITFFSLLQSWIIWISYYFNKIVNWKYTFQVAFIFNVHKAIVIIICNHKNTSNLYWLIIKQNQLAHNKVHQITLRTTWAENQGYTIIKFSQYIQCKMFIGFVIKTLLHLILKLFAVAVWVKTK